MQLRTGEAAQGPHRTELALERHQRTSTLAQLFFELQPIDDRRQRTFHVFSRQRFVAHHTASCFYPFPLVRRATGTSGTTHAPSGTRSS